MVGTRFRTAILPSPTYIFYDGFLTEIKNLALKPHSIGNSPLYPKGTTLDVIQNNRAWATTSDTFFGYPSCEFYERQMAKEAYEYIHSQENCHPCDSFKFNSPFQFIVKRRSGKRRRKLSRRAYRTPWLSWEPSWRLHLWCSKSLRVN